MAPVMNVRTAEAGSSAARRRGHASARRRSSLTLGGSAGLTTSMDASELAITARHGSPDALRTGAGEAGPGRRADAGRTSRTCRKSMSMAWRPPPTPSCGRTGFARTWRVRSTLSDTLLENAPGARRSLHRHPERTLIPSQATRAGGGAMDWHGVATSGNPAEKWMAFVESRQQELGSFLQFDPMLGSRRHFTEDRSPEFLSPSRTISPSAAFASPAARGCCAISSPRTPQPRGKAAEGRRGGGGKDEPRRVRDGILHRKLRTAWKRESLGPARVPGAPAAARGSRSRRMGRFRAGKRHGRLGSPARLVLRHLRAEADVGRGFPFRAGCLCIVP